MIILRQKIFTRAEKEAIKQLWRRTNGLRQLPNGITNLEDAMALKDLSARLNMGGTIEFTPEIRRALDNMGLTKITPELMTRLDQKYKNAAARERFNRIHNGRIGDPNINPTSAITTRNSRAAGDHIMEEYNREKQNLINKANRGSYDYRSKDGLMFSRFYRKKGNGVVLWVDPRDSYSISRRRAPNAEDIYNYNKGDFLSSKNNYSQLKKLRKDKDSDLIAVGDHPSRNTVLHEWGHNWSGKKFPDVPKDNTLRMKKYQDVLGSVDKVAEENMASSWALDQLKNQPGIERDRASLNDAIGTYMMGAKKDILPYKYKYGIPVNSKYKYL